MLTDLLTLLIFWLLAQHPPSTFEWTFEDWTKCTPHRGMPSGLTELTCQKGSLPFLRRYGRVRWERASRRRRTRRPQSESSEVETPPVLTHSAGPLRVQLVRRDPHMCGRRLRQVVPIVAEEGESRPRMRRSQAHLARLKKERKKVGNDWETVKV